MKIMKLSEICEMYQPKTISTKEMVPGGKYTVFGANGAIGKYDKYNHESPQLLVTCRGATCGSVNISEPFSWINGNAMVIKPKENLVTFGYLKYAFLGGINVSGAITGSAQPQITRTTLEQILLPIPSVDYQCFVEKKLDKAFAEIDSLEKNLQLKEEKTNQLLQSILSAAFTNTEEFEMKVEKLGEICEFNPPKKQVREKLKSSDLVSFLPMQELPIGAKDCSTDATKPLEEVIKQYTFFANDDLLVAKITPCFENGKMSIARNLRNGFGFGSSEYIVIRTQQNILIEYLYYFLSQDFTINIGRDLMTGAVGHKRIPVEYFQKLLVPLPSLEVQRILINRLDKAFIEIEKLKSQILIEKVRISSLRQSILSHAFNFEEKTA
jgi:type I restriction enzyme S subunit